MEYNLIVNQKKKSIDAGICDQAMTIKTADRIYDASFATISDHQILLKVNGQNINAFIRDDNGTKTVIIKGRSYEVLDADLIEQNAFKKKMQVNKTIVASPMPAVVIGVLAKIGDKVKKDQALVIVSAMKMETTLFAPYDGIVSQINAKVDDKVMPTDILVDIEKQKEQI
ncbi:MAG: acetyl-CoA carboxylase biotin carboxyl carrier protein subunit [Desulfobacula sp.]|nr:acetyl-CoA carboxylase biotin carboxyl carrier protein subunit [Desulfobacula sp.]